MLVAEISEPFSYIVYPEPVSFKGYFRADRKSLIYARNPLLLKYA
jgi:hypothetical protein